jgi:hypothetical protein
MQNFFTIMFINYASFRFHRGLTSGRRRIVKIIAESLSQHDEKHVVPTSLSVEKEKKEEEEE